MEGVGHNIPNIDGLDSIIRREPPSPVSEWVGFASYAEGRRHGPFDVANVCPETCVPATVSHRPPEAFSRLMSRREGFTDARRREFDKKYVRKTPESNELVIPLDGKTPEHFTVVQLGWKKGEALPKKP